MNHLRKDLRELVGLGSPPAIYTTNASVAGPSLSTGQIQGVTVA